MLVKFGSDNIRLRGVGLPGRSVGCGAPVGVSRRAWQVALAAGLAVSLCGAARAQTSVLWAGAVDGDWTDATKWSSNPDYPDNNNPPGTLYDVTINATGANYTVTLGSNISINSLLMNSSNAWLHHTAGRLSIANSLEIRAGTYNLDGGTIGGGLLKLTGGTLGVSTNANNRLSGVTVQGAMTLGSANTRLKISDGFAHNNVMFINGTGSAVSFDGTQTITSGYFAFTTAGASNRKLTIEGPSTVTLGAGVTVSGGWNSVVGGQLIATGGNTLINGGTINAGVNGSTLFVSPAVLTNTGTLSSQNGGVLTINAANWTNSGTVSASGSGSTTNLSGNWSSSGTIRALTGGVINLGGSFPSTGLGTMNTSGGTVNLTGTMDNTGQSFTFNNATGSWNMNGGTIQGGSVGFADGKTLTIGNNSSSRLSGVIWNGDLDMTGSSGFLTVGSGLTLNGVARLGPSSILTFDGTQTFNTGSVNFQGNTARLANSGGTLTLGPGMAVDVHAYNAARIGDRGGNLVNQGRITADGAGGFVNVVSDNLTNSGVIEALNGATVRLCEFGTASPGVWSNSGILRVNNGSLSLGGSFTRAGLGTIERTGGSVTLDGTLDNTGSSLTLDATTGSWRVGGAAAIIGGTINHTQGAGLLFDSGSSGASAIFNGVTLNGDIDVSATGRGLGIRNGLTLGGTIRLGADQTRIYTGTDQVQTITGGTIALEGPAESQQAYLGIQDRSTLTLSPTTLVRGGWGGVTSMTSVGVESTLINKGRISADLPGKRLSAGAWYFTNEGTLEAINGGSLSVGATVWTNTGLIKVDNGTLSMGGTIHFDPGTTFQRNGGTVNVTGTLDLAGRPLTLGSSTGSWILKQTGIVKGGALTLADGESLIIDTVPAGGPYPSLDGVTLNGDLQLPTSGGLSITHDLALNGTIANSTSGATLNFLGNAGTQTLTGGTLLINRGSAGSSNDALRISGNATLVLSPTTTVRGDNGWIGRNFSGSGTTTLVNQGTISADVSGGFLTIKSDTLNNQGTLEAKDGGALQIDFWTHWSSTGTIRAENGGRVFLGGQTTTAGLGTLVNNGGTFYLSGLLENTGSTLTLDATTGSLVFSSDSGTIKGGIVNLSGGARLGSIGIGHLDGVTVNGDLEYQSVSSINIRNGLALNGTAHLNMPGSSLKFDGTQSFNTGTIAFEGGDGVARILTATTGSTLTLGAQAVVHGGDGSIYTNSQVSIANYGLISADVSGQKITINTDRFDNQGILQAINGGILELIDPPPLMGGTPLRFVNSGIFSIGVGSTALLACEFSQTPEGVLDVHLGAVAGASGVLLAHGYTELDGTLRLTLPGGVVPLVGEQYRIIDLDMAERHGVFAVLDLPTLPQGMWWDTSSLYSGGFVSAVPGPGTVMILGVAVVALPGRRSRARGVMTGGAR